MEIAMISTRLQAVFTYWNRQLPWQWKAAIVLSVLMLVIAPLVIVSASSALQQARHAAVTGKASVKDQRKKSAGLLEIGSLEAVQSFEAEFPEQKTLPDSIQKLLDIAAKKGVILKQADYKAVKGDAGDLIGYRMQMPVAGTYPNLMAFVFSLLAELPNLALNDMSFNRQSIAAGIVDANITMTLYIRHS